MRAVSAMCAMLCAAGASAQTFDFTVNASTSGLTASVNASADLTGTLIGNYNQATNPTGTRTLDYSIIGTRPPAPTNISKNLSGTGTASGNAAGRPAGSFRLSIDTTAGTVAMAQFATNLIGAATPPVFPVNATITYQSFLTAAPNNSYPFIVPIPFPLGNAELTALLLAQTGPAAGALTPTTPGTYTFSLMVPCDVTASLVFSGSPGNTTLPQDVPVSGTVTINGTSATASLSITLNQNQVIEEDQPGPPNQPFDLPPLSGTGDPAHLLLNTTITRQTIGVNGSATLPAAGVIPPPPCGSADYNGDGDVGTDADIEAFFACLAGSCCPTCFGADFNSDGDVGTDADIEAFFRVLAGGAC
jgi:hypothetical protein